MSTKPVYLRKFPTKKERFQKLVKYYNLGRKSIHATHNQNEAESLIQNNKIFAKVLQEKYRNMVRQFKAEEDRLEVANDKKRRQLFQVQKNKRNLSEAEIRYKQRLLANQLLDLINLHHQLSSNHHYHRQLVKVKSMEEAYQAKYQVK